MTILKEAVERIAKGVFVSEYRIYAKKITGGRSEHEVNLEIFVEKDGNENQVLLIKVFFGIKPYHKEWVEFFAIHHKINLGGEIIEYFDSAFEENLLKFFSDALQPGARIFVEYFEDKETLWGLTYGIPPPVSRLGYKLFNLGFTWFKDWYFAEGGMEGGLKLQGEKTLNEEVRKRQLRERHEEVLSFRKQAEMCKDKETFLTRAMERSEKLVGSMGHGVKSALDSREHRRCC